MDNSSAIRMVFKILAVLLIDAITLLLVFSFWTLLNLAVFPAALSAVLLSLICLNFVVLASSSLRSSFGVAILTAVIITTAVYYLAVMVFTGVTYLFIRPKTYLIYYLILTLVYVGVNAGLFVSGHNNQRDVHRQATEKAMTLDINTLMLTLKRNLVQLTASGHDDTKAVMTAFAELEERMGASTPFGRSPKPPVINMETQVFAKLNAINTQALSGNPAGDSAYYESIASQLREARTMIMDREQLMFV